MVNKLLLKFSLLILVSLVFSLPTHAADDKKAAKEQARQMQQIQRKLQEEKAQHAQEKTVLDGQLQETRSKLDQTRRNAEAASRQRATLAKELETVTADKVALEAKLADMEKKLVETEKKLADTTETLQRVAGAKAQVEANLTQRSNTLSMCEAKNDAQHKYGMELLNQYEKNGCVSAIMLKEPFTGLKRVKIENTVEEYREKYDQQKLNQSAAR